MESYEKLYQEQLEANDRLRDEIRKSNELNQKLRADLERLTTHVDAEVARKVEVTKARITEMIRLIDSVIESEQKSIAGWRKLSQ